MVVQLVLLTTVVVLLCTLLLHKYFDHRKYAHIPTMPERWPLFGNAFSLDLSQCHMILASWAEKIGPVFRIRLFNEEILVLNDYESIHDALVTKGSAFAGRPPMYRTSKEDRHRHSIVWQTYTNKLQFLRKEVLKGLKMYGNGLDNLEQKCIPEITTMLAQMATHKGKGFDPWDHIYDAVSNVMLGLTLDKTFDHGSESFQMIKDINYLFNDTFGTGQARGLDYFPWISRLRKCSYSQQLQKALHLRDQFWEREFHNIKVRSDSECVVQRLMTVMSDVKGTEMDISEKTIKECFTNLILAGTDTTSTALTCLLLVFLHHPHVQETMWEELNTHIGQSRLAMLSDMASMPYFHAVLLELLRYISHVSLAVPHYTICDTEVLGIKVPKDMTVYINLWSLHHNPKDWPEPWEFKPERFLDRDGSLLPAGNPVRRKLMPFGAGRRVCLGETLAKNRLFLFAAALVQHFEFVPSHTDQRNGHLPPLDPRTYTMGLVLHPKPFTLQAVSRL